MCGVRVAVDEGEGDGDDTEISDLVEHFAEFPFIQWHRNGAIVLYPLPHLIPEPPLYEHLWALEEEVIDLCAALAADLDDVPEAPGSHEGDAGNIEIYLTQ